MLDSSAKQYSSDGVRDHPGEVEEAHYEKSELGTCEEERDGDQDVEGREGSGCEDEYGFCWRAC